MCTVFLFNKGKRGWEESVGHCMQLERYKACKILVWYWIEKWCGKRIEVQKPFVVVEANVTRGNKDILDY